MVAKVALKVIALHSVIALDGPPAFLKYRRPLPVCVHQSDGAAEVCYGRFMVKPPHLKRLALLVGASIGVIERNGIDVWRVENAV